MRPTREQIDQASYQRWQRRGGVHGHDRDDWIAAEKDLVFALNYRYIARYKLVDAANGSEPVLLGKGESLARRRTCRFCEQTEPSAKFRSPLLALPRALQTSALLAWDECDDCRGHHDSHLAGPFDAFARPIFEGSPPPRSSEIPVAALKALVRLALSIVPPSELTHFDDTIEWVVNPDHAREAAVLSGLGTHLYHTPAPVPAPFVAVARRADDDAPFPYMLVFLGASRAVLQTHLPLCPRDEDLEDAGVRGPELSMSLGNGTEHRSSFCTFLPLALPEPARALPSSVAVFRRRAAGF